MSRTAPALVQTLLGDNWGLLADGCAPDLQQFCDTAATMVDSVAACAARRGFSLSGLATGAGTPSGSDTPGSQLELIERWLAASRYCAMDPLYQSKSTGAASGQFIGAPRSLDGETDRYLRGAIQLDPSGCLNALINRKVAHVAWLGKPPSSQVPYRDRD